MSHKRKRARTERTLEQKYEIVCFREQNKSMKLKDIALHFDVKAQTLSDILKNKEKIISRYIIQFRTGKMKRMKKGKFEHTSRELLEWFLVEPSVSISGEVLRKKATSLARLLKEIADDEEVDMNWVNRWKNQHDIFLRKMCIESNDDVSGSDILHWKHVVSKEIMNKYKPRDILNCDEFGLFWQLTPDKTSTFTDEMVHGVIQSKEHITVLNCVSMSGEKYPLFVVGMFAKPHCFKNILHLPVIYHANSKALMTSNLFREFLRILNQKMKSQNRKVALILDRCPAHPRSVSNLTNVALYFLPSDLTCKTQPLDAGITNSVKCIYRRKFVHRLLVSYANNEDFKYSLLDALNLLNQAWEAVPQNTIINCFRHVGFVDAANPNMITSVTDPEDKIFASIFERVCKFMSIPEHLHFEEYVNADNSLPTTAGSSDTELPESVTLVPTDVLNDQENEYDDSEAVTVPTHREAFQALQILQHFLTTRHGFNESYIRAVKSIKDEVLHQMMVPNRLPKIEWGLIEDRKFRIK